MTLQFTTINLNHYFTTFYFFFTGCFGDFGTARQTMVVWPSEVPRLKIVLPHGVRLLTFAMILLVGSTEVHRMWSPEARAQAFEFYPPVHLVKVHQTPPVTVIGVIGVVGVVAVVVQYDVV